MFIDGLIDFEEITESKATEGSESNTKEEQITEI